MESTDKAKAILSAIIEVDGGSFHGKTRLYKAFYLAHLLHFRDYKGTLSDHPIVRMPRGPAIDQGDMLLTGLCQSGVLQMGKRPIGPYIEDTFTLIKPFGKLAEDELDSIRRAVEWIGDKSATNLSEWTHEFSHTWADTPDGRPMNIYADLLSEMEYDQMKQRHRVAGGLVDAVFS